MIRRIPIYRVTTLSNGKEVERLLVCEINGMYPGENDWVDTIVNAPQTKAELDQLLEVLEAVGQRLKAQHEHPCEDVKCWVCELWEESGLSKVLADMQGMTKGG